MNYIDMLFYYLTLCHVCSQWCFNKFISQVVLVSPGDYVMDQHVGLGLGANEGSDVDSNTGDTRGDAALSEGSSEVRFAQKHIDILERITHFLDNLRV